jgi:hypothetical protein
MCDHPLYDTSVEWIGTIGNDGKVRKGKKNMWLWRCSKCGAREWKKPKSEPIMKEVTN